LEVCEGDVKSNIKLDIIEIGCDDGKRIKLAQDRDSVESGSNGVESSGSVTRNLVGWLVSFPLKLYFHFVENVIANNGKFKIKTFFCVKNRPNGINLFVHKLCYALHNLHEFHSNPLGR
jgi:hypothetical protein